MKLNPSFAVLAAVAVLPSFAQGVVVKVTYDQTYDSSSYPLSGTACSNGANGLESKYPTLGDVPNFPFLGGIPGLTWNSPLCGSCWNLEYDAPDGTKHFINVTAVDEAFTYNIAKKAFTALAGSAGVAAGSVTATATQVSHTPCTVV